jgi:hypothetical protein
MLDRGIDGFGIDPRGVFRRAGGEHGRDQQKGDGTHGARPQIGVVVKKTTAPTAKPRVRGVSQVRRTLFNIPSTLASLVV